MARLELISDVQYVEEPLDAYSRVVTEVARTLSPSVANLQVRRRLNGRRVSGGGSGVAVTPDGYVLTSAHVVDGADGGTAAFVDGRELDFDVVGTDRLSDLAVLRVDGRRPRRPRRSATPTASRSASSSSRSATRTASPAP